MATKLSEAQIKILTSKLHEYMKYTTPQGWQYVEVGNGEARIASGLARRKPALLKTRKGIAATFYQLTPEGEKVRAELLAAKANAAPQADKDVEAQPAFKVGDRVRSKSTGEKGVIGGFHHSGQSWKVEVKRFDGIGGSYIAYIYCHDENLERIPDASQPAPAGEVEAKQIFIPDDATNEWLRARLQQVYSNALSQTGKLINDWFDLLKERDDVLEQLKQAQARIEALEADKRALVEALHVDPYTSYDHLIGLLNAAPVREWEDRYAFALGYVIGMLGRLRDITAKGEQSSEYVTITKTEWERIQARLDGYTELQIRNMEF